MNSLFLFTIKFDQEKKKSFRLVFMAEILPIRRETLSKQSVVGGLESDKQFYRLEIMLILFFRLIK